MRQEVEILQPAFYEKFACIGPSCTDNCCHTWEINIDKEHYLLYKAQQDPSFLQSLRPCGASEKKRRQPRTVCLPCPGRRWPLRLSGPGRRMPHHSGTGATGPFPHLYPVSQKKGAVFAGNMGAVPVSFLHRGGPAGPLFSGENRVCIPHKVCGSS